jgi:rhamnosyltransferase
MISILIKQYLELYNDKNQLLVLGPVIKDLRTGNLSRFLVKKKWNFQNEIFHSGFDLVIPCDFLITSGTFLDIKIFDVVGMFDENLFIDHIDTEFCIRLKNHSINIYGSCKAILNHNLGDDVIEIWFGRWREVHKHSVLPNYYMSRNTIYLILRMTQLQKVA